ncbi:hypothetical protein NDU88_000348, partial [Pleurodeles waltl]
WQDFQRRTRCKVLEEIQWGVELLQRKTSTISPLFAKATGFPGFRISNLKS